jgi:2-polyprenyl-6-methoxyphenol hydroxylase-like FAD-dependent oxidoreductase
MLLARKGYRVLMVDRARFPSDTISTHIIWPHGAEILERWGLLDRIAATGVPAICHNISFDVGPFALKGSVPVANHGEGGLCPRRTVLDKILIDAAAESGVEVREDYTVNEVLYEHDKVAGIRGSAHGGHPAEERAQIVIGADGVHSLVARAVRAPEYDSRPVLACSYYSYFSGVQGGDIEMYLRDNCAFLGCPTNDGLHVVVVTWPTKRFPEVRSDIEGHVIEALETAPNFAERVRQGEREEKWYGTAGVPNYFRKPYGPGWALVGDAGYNRDPISAQGISDAFIDAEKLVGAIDAGMSGRRPLDQSLAEYETRRNDRVRPMYEFTCEMATLEPPPAEMQQLFGALHGNRDATNRFFAAITGATPLPEFMSEDNIGRIMSAASGIR